MTDKRQPFRIAFPAIILPESRGGRRAAIIFSIKHVTSKNQGINLATCIDEKGTPHLQVPLTDAELLMAGRHPMILLEVEGQAAPMAGGAGLVGPDGFPIR
jgi:hypothetical protein